MALFLPLLKRGISIDLSPDSHAFFIAASMRSESPPSKSFGVIIASAQIKAQNNTQNKNIFRNIKSSPCFCSQNRKKFHSQRTPSQYFSISRRFNLAQEIETTLRSQFPAIRRDICPPIIRSNNLLRNYPNRTILAQVRAPKNFTALKSPPKKAFKVLIRAGIRFHPRKRVFSPAFCMCKIPKKLDYDTKKWTLYKYDF